VKTYEDYLKSNKEIPTINIDACLKPKLSTAATSTKPFTSPHTNPIKQNRSDSELNNQNDDCYNIDNAFGSLQINSTSIPGSCDLWRANAMPEYSSQVKVLVNKKIIFNVFFFLFFKYYNFNFFTMCLNELKNEYNGVIAPTDSRFRSDVRSLENGDLGKLSY
jgi:hypothetical protein